MRTPAPRLKPVLDHLRDLRRTLAWVLAFLAGGFLLAVPLAPTSLDWVREPYVRAGLEPIVALRVTQVGGGMAILMRVASWSGLLFSLPLALAAVGAFVFPGLTDRERRWAFQAGGCSASLFALGVWTGHRWCVPTALRWMSEVANWLGTPAEFWETSSYVAFVVRLLLAFGVAFQFPVLVAALGAVGVVSAEQLRTYRRHVVVGLLVVAAWMTPPDPFTQVLMAAPLILLYEGAIALVRLQERRRRQRMSMQSP